MEYYPTPEHRKAAEKLVELLREDGRVVAILLVGSCARGKASRDSCLDLTAIVRDRAQIKPVTSKFERLYGKIPEFEALRKVGRYSHIDFNATTGRFRPQERDWESGPDNFELEIGNTYVYSVVLFERGDDLQRLRSRYLPYYAEELRAKRLEEVKKYMYNNLDHIPLYVARGLYFASFARLYNASQEFLQALFIKDRTYPIAYNKWVKEQLVDILGKPETYRDLVDLMQIRDFESDELTEKSRALRAIAARLL